VGEVEWLSGDRAGKICATAAGELQVEAGKRWIEYSSSVWDPSQKPVRPPTDEEAPFLSKLTINGKDEFIEPLSGTSRHPFANIHCPKNSANVTMTNIFDIRYLVAHNVCSGPAPPPGQRTMLFDMGASQGFHNVPGGHFDTMPTRGDGIKPSIPVFWKMYKENCHPFTDVFAWELNMRITHKQWWGELPAEDRAKVRYFNVGVDEGTMEQARAGTNPASGSFLQMLLSTAKVEDFVIIKVDIDNTDVELTVIKGILERPEISRLVDELYFEYHYNMDGLNFGWGANVGQDKDGKVTHDVDTAIKLMADLRKKGIRAHFWI
jgi:hypothetical protein